MEILEKKNKKDGIFSGSIFGYSWRSRLIVFVSTILSVVFFALAGYFIANLFDKNTKIFIVIGVFISFPVTQFLIYKILIKKNEH